MKNINRDLIKDLFISILIIIAIILIFSVFFYDKISLGKVIPEIQEYELSEKMQNDIGEAYTQEDTTIITSYYIKAEDLKKYEDTKEYTKGKSNPFAEGSTQTSGDTTNTNSNNNSNIEDENPSTNTFYGDDGTK